jgi:hypothetical protein
MRACCAVVFPLLVLIGQISAAPFQNLDFEQASVVWPDPIPGFHEVDPALAFPGWSIDKTAPDSHIHTLFDNQTLGASSINLFDVSPWQGAANFPPIQGRYSVFLYVDLAVYGIPTMKQVGDIPADARALTFAVDQRFQNARVLINGQERPLVNMPGSRMGADLSAYTGRNVELTFSTTMPGPLGGPGPTGRSLFFDDIQFSPIPVPEPASVTLAAIASITAAAGLCFRKRAQRLKLLDYYH